MDRAEALSDLASESSERRLDAARTLGRLARTEDEAVLREAFSRETTTWVRRALEHALTVATATSRPPSSFDLAEDDPTERKAYLEAVKDTSERLVHELRSVLGLATYWAGKEISSYETSKTARQIYRLAAFLGAIDQLTRASVMARSAEFALKPLISDETNSTLHELQMDHEVDLAGPAELVAQGDPALLRLGVRNAIKNALEASAATDEPVTVAWGATDRDYWVSVIDRAGTLPASVGRLFEFGATTKPGHIGAGLTLIRQVALALGGTCELRPTNEGSTTFQLRWPRLESVR